jgi:hypothetical protein
MESNNELSYRSNRFGEGTQPVAVISQLMQYATSVQHIDDLLQWVANAIVRGIGIGAIQLWTMQAYITGQQHVELRIAKQHLPLPLPRNAYMSPQAVSVIERVFHERHNVMSTPVKNIFSPPQADLLGQYRLSYWTSFFFYKNDLLPPIKGKLAPGKISTPLCMVVSLFSQQPLPQQNVRATNFILEQSLRIAATRQLFSATQDEPLKALSQESKLATIQALQRLVPHRTKETTVSQEQNPFAHAVIISERKARRLYAVIDGKKTVAELAPLANLDQQEMVESLQFLLKKQYIQIYESEGRLVEDLKIFNSI